MKKFIEVSTENGKFLVNVNTISCLYTIKDGRTRITLTAPSSKGDIFINAQESYEEVKALILSLGALFIDRSLD